MFLEIRARQSARRKRGTLAGLKIEHPELMWVPSYCPKQRHTDSQPTRVRHLRLRFPFFVRKSHYKELAPIARAVRDLDKSAFHVDYFLLNLSTNKNQNYSRPICSECALHVK